MARNLQIRPDLTVVELDHETVVYDDRTGSLHHLNGPASVIFRLSAAGLGPRECAASISDAFGVPLEQVQRQVRALRRRFRRAGMLEPTPPRAVQAANSTR